MRATLATLVVVAALIAGFLIANQSAVTAGSCEDGCEKAFAVCNKGCNANDTDCFTRCLNIRGSCLSKCGG